LIARGERYCPAHRSEAWRGRPTAATRGYDYQYQKNRKLALERDGYRCVWCGAPATQADHVLAVAKGGTSAVENLVASCGRCNHLRGSADGGRA
jgi:5-methylcytosine-specific restriction endonuclease McrA